jgi:hypothetical protein
MSQTPQNDFINTINLICSITGKLGKLEGTRTGTEDAKSLQQGLYKLREVVLSEIALRTIGDFHIRVGAGNGYVPRVPWIFISKDPGPVSSNTGIAICFGRNGNGLVLGKMYPIGRGTGQTLRSKKRTDQDFINVNGVSVTTRYNDRFVNPQEIYRKDIDYDKFFEYLLPRLETL